MGRQTIESGTQECFSFDAASDQQWGGTRMRVSVNAPSLMRFEGETTGLPPASRPRAPDGGRGYRIGPTIAPIMPVEGWREDYAALLDQAANAVGHRPGADLRVELITHRFTPGSKQVLTRT